MKITITDKAKDYLQGMSKDGYVSLGVKGGGCSGLTYVWALAKDHPDVSWSDPIEDVLVVDPMAEMYIMGSVIDYITELGGSYLAIQNPMQQSGCGCGASFGV